MVDRHEKKSNYASQDSRNIERFTNLYSVDDDEDKLEVRSYRSVHEETEDPAQSQHTRYTGHRFQLFLGCCWVSLFLKENLLWHVKMSNILCIGSLLLSKDLVRVTPQSTF